MGKLEHRKNERPMDNVRFAGPACMTQIFSATYMFLSAIRNIRSIS